MLNRSLNDKKLSLYLLILIFVLYTLVYMTKNCYSAAMVMLVKENALTKSQTGTISAVFYLIYAIFQVPGGIAADKYSPYKLIAIGLFGAAICNWLIVFAESYRMMLLIWSVNAIVQFGVWPSIFKIASCSLFPSHRSVAVFMLMLSSTLGLISSYLIAGFVSGWKLNFLVSAIILFVLTALWTLGGKFFDKKMTEDFSSSSLPTNSAQKNHEGSFWSILITSGLLLILPIIILNTFFSQGVQGVTPTMISESYLSVSPSVASLLNIIPIAVGVLGKFLFRFIYSKKLYNECMSLFITLLIIAPLSFFMMGIGRISVYWIIALVSLIVTITSGTALVVASYIPVRFIKMGRAGTVSGIINAMAALGIVLSNFLCPFIADALGWHAVIISWVILSVIAAILSLIAFFPWKKFIISLK